jgi:hypothetical protein
MQVFGVTTSQATDLVADYLRREARENAVEQGYPDPFPNDEPPIPSTEERVEPTDEARARWLSAVTTREDDRFADSPYDGGEDQPRLVERFGRDFVSFVSHITPVGGYKDLFDEWRFGSINGGSKLFWPLVDGSDLWRTAIAAVKDWNDILDWKLTPRHKAVWVYLKLDIIGPEAMELVRYALPAVKAIRVCVHGDIIERVKSMLGV